MKRLTALLLSIVMVLCLMPAIALPAAAEPEGEPEGEPVAHVTHDLDRTFYSQDEVFFGEFKIVDLAGLAFTVDFPDRESISIDCSTDLYYGPEGEKTDYSNCGFYGGVNEETVISEENPNFFYFDWQPDDENSNYNIRLLYLIIYGYRIPITEVTAEDSHITNFYLNGISEEGQANKDLAIGSTYTIVYDDDSTQDITLTEDMICYPTVMVAYRDYWTEEFVFEAKNLSDYDDPVVKIGDEYAIANLQNYNLRYMGKDAESRWITMWMEVKDYPKVSYNEGDALDLTGGSLAIYNADGLVETVDMTSDLVSTSGFNTDRAGSIFVYVHYSTLRTSYAITIHHNFVRDGDVYRCTTCDEDDPAEVRAIESVVCTQEPTRAYYAGDTVFENRPIDFTGCELELTYADDPDNPIPIVCDETMFWDGEENVLRNYGYLNGDGSRSPYETNSNFYFFSWEASSEANGLDVYFNMLGQKFYVYTAVYCESDVEDFYIAEPISRDSYSYDAYSLVESTFVVERSEGEPDQYLISEDSIVNYQVELFRDYSRSEEYSLPSSGSLLKIGNDFAVVDTIDNIANLFGHECNFLAKSISFWGINNGPTKDEYIENEALDLTGAELIVYYDDNTNEIIPITAEMIEDIDEVTKTAGFYWVTVNFNGESNSFRIDINHNFVVQNGKKVCTGCGAEQPLVTSVVCTQEPTRTYYKQDNLFRNIGLVGSDAEWRLFPCDFSGCKLTVNFGDNTSKEINCDNDLWYDDDTYTIFGFFEDTGEALYSSYDGKMYPREGNPNYYCFSFDSTSESTVDVYFDYIGESYKLYTINYVDTNVKSFSLNIEPSVIAYETFDIPSFYRMREIAQGTDDVVLSDYVYTYTANRMPEESGTVVEIEVDYGGYGVGYEYVTYYDADEFEAEAAKHFSITTEEMRAKLGTSIEDAKESRFCDSRVYFDEERDAYGFYYGVGRDDTGVNLERYGYVAKENNQFELYFEEKEITGDSETIPEEGVAGYDYIEYYNPLAEKTMYYLVSHTPYLIKLEKNGNDIKFISVEQIEAYPSDNQNLITYPSKADYIEKLIGATFTIYNYDNTRQDIVVTEDTICRPTVNFGGDSVCLSDHDTNWLIKLTDNFYAEIDYAENAVNRLGSVRFMNIVKSLADSHVHTWDDGVVTTEPTCTAEGVKTYTCTDCGAVKTEAVAALGHSYKNVTTKATLTANGSIKKTCSRCGDVASTTTIYMASKVTASASSFTYNGKVQKPTITVKDSKGNAIASSNYTLAWSNSNSKAVGTYTVKVTFKGNYSGTKTFTYKILPRQVGGLKFKSATTSSVTITWTKLTEAKYYKVEYSTNGKTWKTAITVATNSATVKNLSAGTKYQFRVTALDSTKKITGKVSSVLKNGTLCAKPTLSSVKSTTAGQATATWKKTTGASKYIVYKSTDKKKWTKVTTTTKLTYTLKGLTKGKKIYVKIVAINAYSKSSADSAVKYTTVKN